MIIILRKNIHSINLRPITLKSKKLHKNCEIIENDLSSKKIKLKNVSNSN